MATKRRTIENSEDLIKALCSIRRRVRCLLFVDSLATLIAWVVATACLFAFLDWWVHFPAHLRTLGLIVGLGWCAVVLFRKVIRPLVTPVSLEQLALFLGRLSPDSRDRLPSAVAYLRGRSIGSVELWERVVAKTLQTILHHPLTGRLNTKKTLYSVLSATAAIGFVSMLQWLNPAFFHVGWQRLALPMGSTQWPKTVQLQPLTGNAVVARGESFTAEMRVLRGDDPDLRAFVIFTRGNERPQRRVMRRDSGGIYRFTLDSMRHSQHYVFAAGDDDTFGHPFSIQIVSRPAVSDARVVFSPPPYAPNQRDITQSLGNQDLIAVAGSHARFEITTNKVLPTKQKSSAGNVIQFAGGRRIPLTATNPLGKILTGRFIVGNGGEFEIRLVDSHGLRSRSDHRYRLRIRPDEYPKAIITQPVDDIELTPRAHLSVAARAVDDFGIRSMQLIASVRGAEWTPVVNLLDHPGQQGYTEAPRINRQYTWRLGASSMSLKPGDVIQYAVEVQDNFALDGREHEPVRSPMRHIRLVSFSELAEQLQQQLFDTRNPLRNLLTRLSAIQNQNIVLDRGPAKEQPLDDQERQSVDSLVRQLHQLSQAGRQAAERINAISRRAEMNRAVRLDVALQADRLAHGLLVISEEMMQVAAISLALAAESNSPAVQHEQLQASIQNENMMITMLRSMLADLQRWNEFADLVRSLKELLDRQENLLRQIRKQAGLFGGQDVAQLESTQQSRLQQSLARQLQLQTDTEVLLKNMDPLSATLDSTHPAAAEALSRAMEASNQWALMDQMEDAAGEIRQNHMNRAQVSQDRVCSGFRAMIMALESKPDRELATLSRELEDWVAWIDRLILAQQKLINHARKQEGSAHSRERNEKLADRQISLSESVRHLSSKIKGSDYEGLAAKKTLLAASGHMQSAATALLRVEWSSLHTAQEQSLSALKMAKKWLRRLQDRTERLIAERSLASILEALVQLRDTQWDLKTQTEAIGQHRRDRGSLSRIDGLKLNQMAQRETDMTKSLLDVTKKIKGSVVYTHVCRKTHQAMKQAAEKLHAHDCQTAVTNQKNVLHNLGLLIDAIEDQPPQAKGQYAASGGGGSGSPTPSRPVPPLAELKVLRTMQEDLNRQTTALNRTLPEPLMRSEKQLQQIETAGLSQREIHDLASAMFHKAEHSGGT